MKRILSLLAFIISAVAVMKGATHISPETISSGFSYLANHKAIFSIAAGPMVMDVTRSRAAYEKALMVAKLIKRFYGVSCIVNQDFFRSEVLIANGTTSYQFQTWQKQMDANRANFPLQQGVADKDLFIGTEAGLFLDNRTAGSGDVFLQSYVNYTVFNSVTTTLNDLQAFYNGLLSLTVDRTVYIPRVSTSEFLYIPETQQSGSQNQSEFSFKKNLRKFDPYFLLSGQNTNYLTLQVVNPGIFQPAATSGQNIVTFYAEGITVQGGADFIDAFAQGAAWFAAQIQAGAIKNASPADIAMLAQGTGSY